MRITRGQLTDLINEEISNALLESQNRRLLEDAMDQDEPEGPMSLDDLIDFAKAYAGLSRDMRNVLKFIMDGRGESVTPDEIEDLQMALGGHHQELDELLDDALKASAMYTDEDEDDGTLASAVRMNR
jgi:hypothetical protein